WCDASLKAWTFSRNRSRPLAWGSAAEDRERPAAPAMAQGRQQPSGGSQSLSR
ncbi:hypothetical protein OY671_013105, partial [Metschnikowia pulcherrima]